jgi:hypothetical protein
MIFFVQFNLLVTEFYYILILVLPEDVAVTTSKTSELVHRKLFLSQ